MDLFFNLALAADLIGRGRPSHKIDLAYLYYLPFCMVFTSNDKLHAELAPYFLRPNQTFVSGGELKADLAKLDAHYDSLPQELKDRGVISFAFYPPLDEAFLVTRLWDKHMSPQWREHSAKPRPRPDAEASKKILEDIRRFEEAGILVPDERQKGSGEPDHMLIKRKVYPQKGK